MIVRRWLWLPVIAIAIPCAAAIALHSAVDPDRIRYVVVAPLEDATRRPVRVGETGFAWLPPRVTLRDVRVEAADASWHVAAARVDLGLSWWSLLRGDIAIGSVGLSAPDLRLPLTVATDGTVSAPTSADGPQWLAFVERVTRDPAFAASALSIADGRAEIGPWQLARVDGSAGLDWTLGLRADLRGTVVGVGELRSATLHAGGLARGSETWTATLELADVDVGALARFAGSEPELEALPLAGHLAGTLRVQGRDGAIEDGELAFAIEDLALHSAGLSIAGPVTVAARWSEDWLLDLSGAAVGAGDWLRKPAGAELRLRARPAPTWPPTDLGSVRIDSAPFEASARASWGETGAALEDLRAALDLAALRPWWIAPAGPVAGRVVIDAGALGAGGDATLAGRFERVALLAPTPEGTPAPEPFVLDGPFALGDGVLRSDGLTVTLADQRLELSGASDLAGRGFELDLRARALDVAAVSAALGAEIPLEGILDGHASFRGRAQVDTLRGSGELTLRDGGIAGAQFPWPVEATDPRWARGDEGERFDHLSARFSLAQGHLELTRFAFEHPFTSAYLHGDVRLADGALDLRGELVVSEELDLGLGGEGQRRVLPIERIGGTWLDPDLQLDQVELREVFAEYAQALQERTGESPGLEFAPLPREPATGTSIP